MHTHLPKTPTHTHTHTHLPNGSFVQCTAQAGLPCPREYRCWLDLTARLGHAAVGPDGRDAGHVTVFQSGWVANHVTGTLSDVWVGPAAANIQKFPPHPGTPLMGRARRMQLARTGNVITHNIDLLQLASYVILYC